MILPLKYQIAINLVFDFDQVNEYQIVRKYDYVGFAEFYLAQFINNCKSDEEIDRQIYTQLVELDARLGTTASDQLFHCLRKMTRSNIIKVIIYEMIHS